MAKKLLIILQNAYGVEDGYVPSYDKPSFSNCHTGRRLKRALPMDIEFTIVNSSPLVGKTADSIFEPDFNYVGSCIKTYAPDIILACGQNAKKVIQTINVAIPTVFMPHPAYRCLTNQQLNEIRAQITQIAS